VSYSGTDQARLTVRRNLLCAPPTPPPPCSFSLLLHSFLSLCSTFALAFLPKILQKTVLQSHTWVETLFAAQMVYEPRRCACLAHRIRLLARFQHSSSAAAYAQQRPYLFLRFSNHCSSQAKRFHPSSSRPLTVAARYCTATATAKVSPKTAPFPTATGTAAVSADLYLHSLM
jgi:hypothetical protein